MTNSPAISVVMPVYNGEKYLSQSIESILNQTFKNFEFLIVYDKSTDNTESIIYDYQTKDSRIKIINGNGNGIIGALNEGIIESKGNFIARHDADDISILKRLEIQYKFITENKLDICGGDYILIDEDESLQKSINVAKKEHEILLTMASNVPFAHPSVLINKSFLITHKLNYGVFGHKVAEDLDLWMQMYNRGAKFGNVDAILLKYRLLNDSLSSVNNKLIKKEVSTQFNIFVSKNLREFKYALELFCKAKDHDDNIKKVAIKALFRYAAIDFNIRLIFRCWRKAGLYNFIFGFLSYMNSIIFFGRT